MEGGSNGHRSYETDFSVRYLAGAVAVRAAAIVVFVFVVIVVVIVAVVELALLRGPLALALELDLDRSDGIEWLVVGGGLGRLDLGDGEVVRDVRRRRVHRRRVCHVVELGDVVDRGRAGPDLLFFCCRALH